MKREDKMMYIKRIAAVLLALTNVVCFSACGADENETEKERVNESAKAENTETESDDGYEKDNLPDDLSFDGATIHIGYSAPAYLSDASDALKLRGPPQA